MAQYTYNSQTYDIDLHNNPLLQAAFEVAVDAHKDHAPRKNSGKPYIEHLILVYNILDKFGCSDTQKAIGLLHDTVEDYYGSRSNAPVDMLRGDLIAKLDSRHPAEKRWLDEVCNGVANLTNGAILYNDKRTWRLSIDPEFKQGETKRIYQTRRAMLLNEELRQIKIADQAASVMDDILYCKLPSVETPSDNIAIVRKMQEHELTFALKGYDVTDAAVNSDESNPYFRFYAKLYVTLRDMFEDARHEHYDDMLAKRREVAEGDFLDTTIHQARAHRRFTLFNPIELPESVLHWRMQGQPLERVTLSKKTGKVVGYRFYDDDHNKTSRDRLLEELEQIYDVRVTTRPYSIKEHGETLKFIDFHIKNIMNNSKSPAIKGVDFDVFMDKAIAVNAVDRSKNEEIKAIKTQLAKNMPQVMAR